LLRPVVWRNLCHPKVAKFGTFQKYIKTGLWPVIYLFGIALLFSGGESTFSSD
jgi:hypothetical protein